MVGWHRGGEGGAFHNSLILNRLGHPGPETNGRNEQEMKKK